VTSWQLHVIKSCFSGIRFIVGHIKNGTLILTVPLCPEYDGEYDSHEKACN
jgi:hypothetical protein